VYPVVQDLDLFEKAEIPAIGQPAAPHSLSQSVSQFSGEHMGHLLSKPLSISSSSTIQMVHDFRFPGSSSFSSPAILAQPIILGSGNSFCPLSLSSTTDPSPTLLHPTFEDLQPLSKATSKSIQLQV
jgi:hypothetical protein